MSSPFDSASAALLLIPLAALVACSNAPQPEGIATPQGDPFFVTAEQIAASGASTAWDALRLTVPILQFREDGRGQPARITRRGRSSIVLSDQPVIWVDNLRIGSLRDLDLMPAGDIESIQVLSPLDATTRFGGASTTGAIVIRTKSGA